MRIANATDQAAGTLVRYRLDVIAADVSDVVQSAGGWLFDRAMAGWDVNLHLAGPADSRPLRVLGIRTCAWSTADAVLKSPATQSIAVSAQICNTDARVRDSVVMAARRGFTEVTLWGDTWPPDFPGAQTVRHPLSSAARAFKAAALAAAALPCGSVSATEAFRSGRWCPAYEPDLLPGG
ncbi:MAG: hypothetical protein WAM92_02585 [Mycobacterium sp.]